MPISRILKKLLGKNEKVHKNFTLSARYLKIKIIFNLSIYLVIFLILAIAALFFISQQSNIDSFSYSPQAGISYQSSSPVINQTVIYAWLILAAIYLLIIFPIYWFYYFYYLRISNQYIFTDQRVLIKRGWLNIKTTSIHYNRMTDASIKQDLIDRLIGIGTLSISTAGSEGYKISLNHIEKPNHLKKQLYELKEEYRQNLYGNKSKNDSDFEHY